MPQRRQAVLARSLTSCPQEISRSSGEGQRKHFLCAPIWHLCDFLRRRTKDLKLKRPSQKIAELIVIDRELRAAIVRLVENCTDFCTVFWVPATRLHAKLATPGEIAKNEKLPFVLNVWKQLGDFASKAKKRLPQNGFGMAPSARLPSCCSTTGSMFALITRVAPSAMATLITSPEW